MTLSDSFLAELAAIDAVLGPGVAARLEELNGELEALRPRREVARSRGFGDLESKIAEMIAAREAERTLLAQFAPLEPRPRIGLPVATPSLPKRGPVSDFRVVDPEPEPEAVFPPPEPPKPQPSLPRPQLVRAIQAFGRREREFEAMGGWDRAREAELKGLVCEARGLIELTHEADFDDSTLRESIRLLRDEFNDRTDAAPFFGFNLGRAHAPAVWEDLAEAYTLLASAERCLDWLEAHPDGLSDNEELVKLCGAAEAWIHRLNDEHGLGFTDELQREVHRRVETLAGGTFVPWWYAGEGRVTTEEVARQARRLPTLLADATQRYENALNKDRAMIALQELAASLEADGDLEETLVPAVRRCLEAGIPPSNKALVAACLPYRTVLKETGDRTFARLNEYLQKEDTRLTLRNVVPTDGDAPADPELDPIRDEVRAYLRGKTVLFVGGRRIPEKQREVEEALDLKELLWPDAAPDTLLHDFTASALKADVVCYLIRWSRHSYKQVIDFARTHGKATVTLKAGVGVNRLVHDIHAQLLAKQAA